MRTNLVLDDAIVGEAFRLTGIKTKRELVHQALLVLIERQKKRSLLELKGKIAFADGYDHRTLREDRP